MLVIYKSATTPAETTTMSDVGEIPRLPSADGVAAVLAIGTANPPNCLSQDEYHEYYFRVTNSTHLADQLKDTLKIICKHPNIPMIPIYCSNC